MDINAFKTQIKETVVQSMLDFMSFSDEDCGFTKEDVDECEAILVKYLEKLDALCDPSDEEIMEEVKTVVLALNELNEKTDYCMIETEEREAIWDVIQSSAVECGLTDPADDITEEWREW